MTPGAYALAVCLLALEEVAPLPVRAAWLSALRRYEPSPHEVTAAALKAHESGLMRAGRLTPEGVRLALLCLPEEGSPPPFYRQPHGGAGGEQ